MPYHTLHTIAHAEYAIKKSRFLAYAYPITDKTELMFHVEQLREKYSDARHICYAFCLGNPNNPTQAGSFDDGEPKGTAGRPMLAQLLGAQLGDVAVVVVRYFGGTKLGAGGLARAYGQAVKEALALGTRVVAMQKTACCIKILLRDEARLRDQLAQVGGAVLAAEYGDKGHFVVLSVELGADRLADLMQSVMRLGGEILEGAKQCCAIDIYSHQ